MTPSDQQMRKKLLELAASYTAIADEMQQWSAKEAAVYRNCARSIIDIASAAPSPAAPRLPFPNGNGAWLYNDTMVFAAKQTNDGSYVVRGIYADEWVTEAQCSGIYMKRWSPLSCTVTPAAKGSEEGVDWKWPAWLTAPWIAKDKRRNCWCAHEDEPTLQSDFWQSDYCAAALTSVLFDFTPPPCANWKKSKRRNPNAPSPPAAPEVERPATLRATICSGEDAPYVWLWRNESNSLWLRQADAHSPWSSRELYLVDRVNSDSSALAIYDRETAERGEG